MKEWTTFSGCVGKTIQKISFDQDNRWLVLFTDNTWSAIGTEYCQFAEAHELHSKRPEPEENYHTLHSLGVIDAEERDRIINELREKAAAKQLAFERAQYKRLHAKFGKGKA